MKKSLLGHGVLATDVVVALVAKGFAATLGQGDARLVDVCFVDAKHGWAVGDRGTIWHTDNGGRNWRLQSSRVACNLKSVCFLDANCGWAAGGIATIVTSFDVWGHNMPCIEIHGTEGSLSVPDPNGFGGEVKVKRASGEWGAIPLTHKYAENGRGLGVADMAAAVAGEREHRASGELAFHVLDIMHAVHEASDAGTHITLESSCKQPAAMPMMPLTGKVE